MTPPDQTSSRAFAVFRDPISLPPEFRGAVAAIGNFDGVHRGHAALFERARHLADEMGRACIALTFEPHPSDFFAGKSVIFRLTPPGSKALALERLGLDGAAIMTFDSGLAGLDAEAFVRDVIVRRLGLGGVVAGYDFHFGKGRSGDPAFLAEAGRRHGFRVEIVDRIAADAQGSLEAVSSTAIRKALEAGDVARARELLGRDWFVRGEVVHGQKIGRTLGFPTANLRLDPSCRLRHGIYAVRVRLDGAILPAIASFGSRPTFDDGPPLLEVFVFDFSGDLYGREIEVDFVGWIRGEEKFADIPALVAQMNRDCEEARAMLAA